MFHSLFLLKYYLGLLFLTAELILTRLGLTDILEEEREAQKRQKELRTEEDRRKIRRQQQDQSQQQHRGDQHMQKHSEFEQHVSDLRSEHGHSKVHKNFSVEKANQCHPQFSEISTSGQTFQTAIRSSQLPDQSAVLSERELSQISNSDAHLSHKSVDHPGASETWMNSKEVNASSVRHSTPVKIIPPDIRGTICLGGTSQEETAGTVASEQEKPNIVKHGPRNGVRIQSFINHKQGPSNLFSNNFKIRDDSFGDVNLSTEDVTKTNSEVSVLANLLGLSSNLSQIYDSDGHVKNSETPADHVSNDVMKGNVGASIDEVIQLRAEHMKGRENLKENAASDWSVFTEKDLERAGKLIYTKDGYRKCKSSKSRDCVDSKSTNSKMKKKRTTKRGVKCDKNEGKRKKDEKSEIGISSDEKDFDISAQSVVAHNNRKVKGSSCRSDLEGQAGNLNVEKTSSTSDLKRDHSEASTCDKSSSVNCDVITLKKKRKRKLSSSSSDSEHVRSFQSREVKKNTQENADRTPSSSLAETGQSKEPVRKIAMATMSKLKHFSFTKSETGVDIVDKQHMTGSGVSDVPTVHGGSVTEDVVTKLGDRIDRPHPSSSIEMAESLDFTGAGSQREESKKTSFCLNEVPRISADLCGGTIMMNKLFETSSTFDEECSLSDTFLGLEKSSNFPCQIDEKQQKFDDKLNITSETSSYNNLYPNSDLPVPKGNSLKNSRARFHDPPTESDCRTSSLLSSQMTDNLSSQNGMQTSVRDVCGTPTARSQTSLVSSQSQTSLVSSQSQPAATLERQKYRRFTFTRLKSDRRVPSTDASSKLSTDHLLQSQSSHGNSTQDSSILSSAPYMRVGPSPTYFDHSKNERSDLYLPHSPPHNSQSAKIPQNTPHHLDSSELQNAGNMKTHASNHQSSEGSHTKEASNGQKSMQTKRKHSEQKLSLYSSNPGPPLWLSRLKENKLSSSCVTKLAADSGVLDEDLDDLLNADL